MLKNYAGENCRPFHGLPFNLILILGLTPQALCFRLLRRLKTDFLCKACLDKGIQPLLRQ